MATPYRPSTFVPREGLELDAEAPIIEGWFARTDSDGHRIALFFIARDGQEYHWDDGHWTKLHGTPVRDRVFWADPMTDDITAPEGIPEPR